jgi:hypothetical protein
MTDNKEILKKIIKETCKKIGKNKYRLYSGKGKNLGTSKSKAGCKKREKQVQYFKYKNG